MSNSKKGKVWAAFTAWATGAPKAPAAPAAAVVEAAVVEAPAAPAAEAPAAPAVETVDDILEARIAARLDEARQRKAIAKKAEAKATALDKAMKHTNKLKASFVLADNELVGAMKAEANALAKLDAKVDERLAQEDSVLSMIQESNARMARLAGGELFAEESNSDAWGQATEATAKAEDVWGDCKVYKAPNLAVEADWGPEVAEEETFLRFENAFNDVWEEVEAES